MNDSPTVTEIRRDTFDRFMIDFMHRVDEFGIIAARESLNEACVETQVDRGREWWMLYGGFTRVTVPLAPVCYFVKEGMGTSPLAYLNNGKHVSITLA